MRFLVSMVLFLLGEGAVSSVEPFLIEDIKVEGLDRTEPGVVLVELVFKVGDTVTLAEVEKGVQRVRNTDLFINVTHQLSDGRKGKVLTVHAEDRWTTIPIAKFSSGGGVTQAILGVYDPNILGKNLEAGGQYERLGETNSGVVWFRNRRLFGSFLFLDLQAWNINRLRTKYVPEAVKPKIKAGFLHKRTKFYIGLQKELKDWLKFGILAERHDDKFSNNYVSDKVRRERLDSSLPPETRFLFYGANLELGGIDVKDFLYDGALARLEYRHANAISSGVKDFDQFDLSLQYFKSLPFRATFGERVLAGVTRTDAVQYWYYLGGLDRIRGFSDNRFAGRYYWLSNTELRVPFLRTGWFFLQNILFYDVAAIGEKSADLDQPNAASVGLGLRLIAPKIYRLVARLDIARPVLRQDEMGVSFGVQQFF